MKTKTLASISTIRLNYNEFSKSPIKNHFIPCASHNHFKTTGTTNKNIIEKGKVRFD